MMALADNTHPPGPSGSPDDAVSITTANSGALAARSCVPSSPQVVVDCISSTTLTAPLIAEGAAGLEVRSFFETAIDVSVTTGTSCHRRAQHRSKQKSSRDLHDECDRGSLVDMMMSDVRFEEQIKAASSDLYVEEHFQTITGLVEQTMTDSWSYSLSCNAKITGPRAQTDPHGNATLTCYWLRRGK